MGMLPPTPSSRVNVPGIGLIATGALGVITSLGLMLLWPLGGVAALADSNASKATGHAQLLGPPAMARPRRGTRPGRRYGATVTRWTRLSWKLVR